MESHSATTKSRPRFNSSITSDRLEEAARRPSSSSLRSETTVAGSVRRSVRRSVFRELGLETDEVASPIDPAFVDDPKSITQPDEDSSDALKLSETTSSFFRGFWKSSRLSIKASSSAPPTTFSSVSRFALIISLIAVVVPALSLRGDSLVPNDGADAGVIPRAELVENGSMIQGRANSPTDVCTRWSHQSALVNGTVYVYGGQAKTSSGQTTNTWNNDFLTLDLTETWQISSPSLTGLPLQPSGPPAVSNGYLWNSYTSLFLYGGEFADNPAVSPLPVSTWEYNLANSHWIEHPSPVTTGGNNSDPGGQPVQRSAEGAGLSVPELGLSWYFGGHQDLFTTQGWSNQIARIYLRSLLEFTHPSFMNTGVQGLGAGESGASNDGAYRNITQGGLQTSAGFTERADGVLVYVPGWGTSGILLGLAGGTADTFTEMNEIDIFDIASSTWYKQATSGSSPPIRVNPCAVVFAAPDASSFNIYLYGGQNLQPYGNQTQYSDLWILTVPSFIWVSVDLSGESNPQARAGHTCHAWDGQMIVIGGYVGTQISCDSPGVYVLNATSLQWQNSFSALTGPNPSWNPQNQQIIQEGSSGLSGSYSYQVPSAVQKVIGGDYTGGATATSPAAGSATAGPIATGKPPVFTVTQSGSTIVSTAQSTAFATTTASSTSAPAAAPSASPDAKPSVNAGAVAAGVVAGALFFIAAYLAFCMWLYRRQLALYKNHVVMSQRVSLGFSPSPDNSMGAYGSRFVEKPGTILGAFGTQIGRTESPGQSSMGSSGGPSTGSGSLPHHQSSIGSGNYTHWSSQEHGSMPVEDHTEYLGAGGVAGESTAHEWGGIGRTTNSSAEDLLAGTEPSFVSVVMSPRRTLRVINRD